MPTGGDSGEYYALAQKYGNDATNTNSLQYNLSTSLPGYYTNSSTINQGIFGIWWSSTYSISSVNMYGLELTPTYVYLGNYSYNRNRGHTMRCLMAD